ncbi:hypothetical protein [Streptomyces caelestis]|jgi:hypothetical protein|uniref:Uncharacterized protein n=1 Tax=Streptomyces caelestis TaxID=36816 RepID=A0A7W9H7H7_9ACTN|nr:hypothetical protein [Streptomyces caelestis]MBB5796876.1 hypothetical protein [Streptomyces caelestis]GGW34278.1 hypothetical protein GCM10010320_11680 [Streptomyces caelestis]
MSLRVRRIAVVSLSALALTAGGTVVAAGASAQPAATTVVNPGPDGLGGGHHDGPPHYGPFEFPRYGSVSGGFSWSVQD